MEPLLERPCPSLTVNGNDLAPDVVPTGTFATNVKTLLPATASPPLTPSSKNCCAPEPPIVERSALTNRALLGGLAPGVTETVKVEASPGKIEFGFAAPS